MSIKYLTDSSDEFINRFCQLSDQLNVTRRGKYSARSAYFKKLITEMRSTEHQLWIAQKNNKDIARIAVIKSSDPKIVYFGLFEIDVAVAEIKIVVRELTNRCCEWAKGAEQILGPIDFNTWFGNRFKIIKTNYHFSWEPQNPIEYMNLFLTNKFEVAQEYISMIYDDSVVSWERTKSAYEAALADGHTFRPVDPDRKDEAAKLYRLNVLSFQETYLYQPISSQTYEKMILNTVPKDRFKYSFFISDKEGSELGYLFSFVENNFLIIKSLLIDPAFQGARLSSALLHRSLIEARAHGVIQAVGAMVRKGNKSELFFKHLQQPIEVNNYVMLSKKCEINHE